MARHGGNNLAVAGSQNFVAGALIGNAVGNVFRANADFNDCMQASGFIIADGQGSAMAPVASIHTAPLQPSAEYPLQSTGTQAPALLLPQAVNYNVVNAKSVNDPTGTPVSDQQRFKNATGMPLPDEHGLIRLPPTTPNGDYTYIWPKSGTD